MAYNHTAIAEFLLHLKEKEQGFMFDLIADIRKDYRLKDLSEADVDPHPIKQFDSWWREAINSKLEEPNAMTLATASADGLPSARIVLLKGFDQNGFVFFTNYHSFKAQHLLENPRACLVFFWKELERQVRITGVVEKTNEVHSDEYFNSRPEMSRIGAIVSPQSQVISDRQWLENRVADAVKDAEGSALTRPPHWGGFLVRPVTIEFWQGRASRLHDRLQYSLEETGEWTIQRLAP